MGGGQHYSKLQAQLRHENEGALRRQIEKCYLEAGQVLGKVVLLSRLTILIFPPYDHSGMHKKAISTFFFLFNLHVA
jgi:hypothetical protein